MPQLRDPMPWSVKSESYSVRSVSLWPHGLYSSWNSPGQNSGVGSLSLLQEIFPTQGLNPGLPHCRWILYQLSHKRSPRILEWVAYPFSSGFSQPRNWTEVSCIASRFFTNWALREALWPIDPACHTKKSHMLQQRWKIPHATTKTQHSQINEFLKK